MLNAVQIVEFLEYRKTYRRWKIEIFEIEILASGRVWRILPNGSFSAVPVKELRMQNGDKGKEQPLMAGIFERWICRWNVESTALRYAPVAFVRKIGQRLRRTIYSTWRAIGMLDGWDLDTTRPRNSC